MPWSAAASGCAGSRRLRFGLADGFNGLLECLGLAGDLGVVHGRHAVEERRGLILTDVGAVGVLECAALGLARTGVDLATTLSLFGRFASGETRPTAFSAQPVRTQHESIMARSAWGRLMTASEVESNLPHTPPGAGFGVPGG